MLLLLRFQHWREDNPMPFVSVFEQEILDQKQQARENCLRGIELGLELKFGEEGKALFAEVSKQTDTTWLRRFLDGIKPAASYDDFRKPRRCPGPGLRLCPDSSTFARACPEGPNGPR